LVKLLKPLSPTLFPYTTLFRSGIDVAPPDRSAGCLRDVDELESKRIDVLRVSKAATLLVDHVPGVDQVRPASRLSDTCEDWYSRDRKSTRLNSSHRTISYAVFC